MSRRFIFLALLILSVCWTSTCEAQLLRRGATRRPNQAYYPQQPYAQRSAQAPCNNGLNPASAAAQPNLYRLPDGRYAVFRGGRYYYASPADLQAINRQQQARRNAYAEQMYGQQKDQPSQIQAANTRANATAQRTTALSPTAANPDVPRRAVNPNSATPSLSGAIDSGPFIEGPAIVGPTVVNDSVPMPATSQSVIQRVTGNLPVGNIPPAANIPVSDAAPVAGAAENQEGFSVLEKSDKDK
jgi:hypothetical protein